MENLIGKITASLIEKERSFPESLIDKVNDNIKPPEAIKPDDIYIRAMYLLSDQVNSYGGQFPIEEHDNIIGLLIDCPVLVGHRKDSLPIARTFHAEKEQRDGRNWVKVYFYWLKNSDKGEDLRKNIDGGIYKECSISFIFSFPECSICGADIRECRHRPFQKYDTRGGGRREAHFNYRQIEKVLEVSLVYRGSVHDTSITRDLFVPSEVVAVESSDGMKYKKGSRYRIWDLNCLDENKDYAVMPAYEALGVILEKNGDMIRILSPDSKPIENDFISKYMTETEWPEGDYGFDCRLTGYRGKSKLPEYELIKLLNGNNTAVRRVEIKVYDLLYYDRQRVPGAFKERRSILEDVFTEYPKMLVPVNVVGGSQVEKTINQSRIRYGFEIVECDSSISYLYTRRKIVPLEVHEKYTDGSKVHYRLHGISEKEHLPVSTTVNSDLNLNEGDLVEVEVYSICREENSLKLINPKIIDAHSTYSDNIDIAYLLDSRAMQSSYAYTVYEKNKGEIALDFENKGSACFLLRGYSTELVDNRRRLLTESIPRDDLHNFKVYGSGTIVDFEARGEAEIYNMRGFFNGRFVLRPILLNGNRHKLFYRLGDDNSVGGKL